MEMEVKTRSLEITIISAEDLRFTPGHLIKKISTFVTVRSDPNNSQSTRSYHDGGTCPRWDEKLQLALPPTARSITVEVYCKFGVGRGPTQVGSAEIPISDIVEGYVPAYLLQFLSYRLKRNRERNGIINLSARIVGPDCIGRPMQQKGEKVPLYGNSGTAIGIPVGALRRYDFFM